MNNKLKTGLTGLALIAAVGCGPEKQTTPTQKAPKTPMMKQVMIYGTNTNDQKIIWEYDANTTGVATEGGTVCLSNKHSFGQVWQAVKYDNTICVSGNYIIRDKPKE